MVAPKEFDARVRQTLELRQTLAAKGTGTTQLYSPRSQGLMAEVSPVLEAFGYEESDVHALLKRCRYERGQIHAAVSRIAEEQSEHGEWSKRETADERKARAVEAKERREAKEREREAEAERIKAEKQRAAEERKRRNIEAEAERRRRAETEAKHQSEMKQRSATKAPSRACPWRIADEDSDPAEAHEAVARPMDSESSTPTESGPGPAPPEEPGVALPADDGPQELEETPEEAPLANPRDEPVCPARSCSAPVESPELWAAEAQTQRPVWRVVNEPVESWTPQPPAWEPAGAGGESGAPPPSDWAAPWGLAGDECPRAEPLGVAACGSLAEIPHSSEGSVAPGFALAGATTPRQPPAMFFLGTPPKGQESSLALAEEEKAASTAAEDASGPTVVMPPSYAELFAGGSEPLVMFGSMGVSDAPPCSSTAPAERPMAATAPSHDEAPPADPGTQAPVTHARAASGGKGGENGGRHPRDPARGEGGDGGGGVGRLNGRLWKPYDGTSGNGPERDNNGDGRQRKGSGRGAPRAGRAGRAWRSDRQRGGGGK